MVCPPINENTNTNTNIIIMRGERKRANQMTCPVINKIKIQNKYNTNSGWHCEEITKQNGQSSQQGYQSKNFSPNSVNNSYSWFMPAVFCLNLFHHWQSSPSWSPFNVKMFRWDWNSHVSECERDQVQFVIIIYTMFAFSCIF